MHNEMLSSRRIGRLALAIGLALAGTAAYAQPLPPADGAPPEAEAEAGRDAPAPRGRNSRGDIRPYLEISQVLSADLDGGETLTYTSVAAGVDGHIQTRRVTAQISYRYERNIDWNDALGDTDVHSGIASVNVQVVPGALSIDAGALATRTGGEGRALGVTNRDDAVNVYSGYVGPSLSTHVGPVAVNASYQLGYVKIDDDRIAGTLSDDFDESVAHNATASVGMAPGPLPFGWTVGAGYAREDSGGRFDNRFEGAYVRADVVVPVSHSLALTAGVGYETIEAGQRDVVRDINGDAVIGPNGQPTPDPSAPRVLTYDMDGVMYDAGIIYRPGPRTELQARAGRRYGSTTVVGSLAHQFNRDYGVSAMVYDTVESFGQVVINDLRNLPDDFNVHRDPLTGGLGGCVTGAQGAGVCLGNSLQSISSATFRARGGTITFAGSRRLWTFGVGAGYAHRRYSRPSDPVFNVVTAGEDESFSLFGSVGRELSRTSDISLSAYASWFSSDLAALDDVTSLGGTLSYSRSFILDRLQLQAALGIYNSDDGVDSATNASALAGLRYTFW